MSDLRNTNPKVASYLEIWNDRTVNVDITPQMVSRKAMIEVGFVTIVILKSCLQKYGFMVSDNIRKI